MTIPPGCLSSHLNWLVNLQGHSETLAGTGSADETSDGANDSTLAADDTPHVFRCDRKLIRDCRAIDRLSYCYLVRLLGEKASRILDEILHDGSDSRLVLGTSTPAARSSRATVFEGWAPCASHPCTFAESM